jgi:hypothetical protein
MNPYTYPYSYTYAAPDSPQTVDEYVYAYEYGYPDHRSA